MMQTIEASMSEIYLALVTPTELNHRKQQSYSLANLHVTCTSTPTAQDSY
nr:MAG TPA: hypothetical protein [Caudoviricetes sp.]